MRLLDRYVLREWTRIFFLVLVALPIIVILFDVTDRLDRYMSRGLTKGAVAVSYLYGLPETMFLILPAAVLLATVFTVSALGRHSELTAAKASGVSFHRMIRPLVAAAGVAFVLGLILGELAPVGATRKLEVLGERAIRSTTSRYNFVYRADRGWVYAVGALEVAPRQMRDVILKRDGTGEDYPTIVVAAQVASFDDTTAGWTLKSGALRYLPGPGPGREIAFAFDSLRTRTLTERPTDLLAQPKDPDEMRYAELGRYVDALARSGTDAKKLAVEHALKIALPFTCVIIALFGAPLAITSPRSGLAYGIGVSLATAFIFLLAVQLSKAVGAGGVLPPLLAAWLPNLVFGAAAVWLLKKTRT